MDLIKHTTQWVNGEVLQGRIGFGIGILIAILFLYFANFQQSFYKGMILPFIILQLILLGYSSSLMVMRPKHIEKVAQSLTISKEKARSEELEKSQKEDKVFSILRPIWAVLFVVSLILFFVLANDFYRGMSLGFVAFFMVAFTFDTLLHLRLKTYLLALQAFN
jgi:uncharacterized membrane protein YhaH (DUF805 family)